MSLIKCLVEGLDQFGEEVSVEINLIPRWYHEVEGDFRVAIAVLNEEHIQVMRQLCDWMTRSLDGSFEEEFNPLSGEVQDDSTRGVLRGEVAFEHA